MTPNITVTRVTKQDRDVVFYMFWQLLKSLDQYENDMLPTMENAAYMVDQVLMPAAMREEAVLLAWDNENPVGGIFWCIQAMPYTTRWKIAMGYGTYIEKEYRGQRVSSLLRNTAIKILQEFGVEKVIGMPHLKNEQSIKTWQHCGAQPYARIDLLDIKTRV